MKPAIELLRDVLDHDIVDDIEFDHVPGKPPAIAALVVGPGGWAPRLPALAAVVARWMFGRSVVRVPWDDVAELGQSLKLKRRAGELGLGRIERKAARWLQRIPGS